MKPQAKVCTGDVPREPVWWIVSVPGTGKVWRTEAQTAFGAAATHGYQLHQVVVEREPNE